jgi:hypothetical protein
MVFSRETPDGTFEVQLHIKDDLSNKYDAGEVLQLAGILEMTAKTLRDAIQREDRDELMEAMKLKGES